MRNATIEVNLWVAIVLLLVIIGSILYGVYAADWANLTTYPKSGTVCAVSIAHNTITIVDRMGDEWEWEDDARGWHRGDMVSMVMQDKHRTPLDNTDDIILKVRYEGHEERFH
jgi:hypothetical protein